jgi:hypothetical protein
MTNQKLAEKAGMAMVLRDIAEEVCAEFPFQANSLRNMAQAMEED